MYKREGQMKEQSLNQQLQMRNSQNSASENAQITVLQNEKANLQARISALEGHEKAKEDRIFALERENRKYMDENDDLSRANRDLKNKAAEFGGAGGGAGGMGGGGDAAQAAQFQRKITYLQDMIGELEKEKTRALIRATSAEEQLVETQKQMDEMVREHAREVMRLKKG